MDENRKRIERVFGKPFERIEADLVSSHERLTTPIDFEQLIADGLLEHVSGMRYRLLIPPKELPRHVRDQIINISGTIIQFDPRSAKGHG